MDCLQALTFANNGRYFFSTRDGRTVVEPKGIKPPDSVCLLYCAGSFIILRFDRHKETPQRIGNAYIYGLMAGEALEMNGRNADD